MTERQQVLIQFYEGMTTPVYYCEEGKVVWENAAASAFDELKSEIAKCVVEQPEELQELVKDDKRYQLRFRKFENGCFVEVLETQSLLLIDFLSSMASLPDVLSYISRTASGHIFHALSPLRMILEDTEQYQGLRYLDEITGSNYRLFRFSSLLQEYQNLLKLETPEYDEVDFTQEMEYLFSAVRLHLLRNSVAFSYHLPSTPVIGFGDMKRLNIALLQLISNAFYFTAPENEVRVNMSENDGELLFEVWDKGTGIAPNLMNKVFEPFYSYDPNTGNVAGGGLGLPYVALFAQKYGGSCNITSSDRGSCVRLRISILTDSKQVDYFKNRRLSSTRFEYSSSESSPINVYLSNVVNRQE